MINYIKDVDLFNDIEKYDVVLVGTNTYNILGNGLQRKIRKKYPSVHKANLKTKYGDKNKLGTTLNVDIGGTVIMLCYITGYPNARPDLKTDYLDYDALEKCMSYINNTLQDKKIATTVIGSSRFDGNGDKDRIINILEKFSTGIDLTVYDYYQMSRDEENKAQWLEIQKYKDTDYELYKKLSKERKKNWKETYL